MRPHYASDMVLTCVVDTSGLFDTILPVDRNLLRFISCILLLSSSMITYLPSSALIPLNTALLT